MVWSTLGSFVPKVMLLIVLRQSNVVIVRFVISWLCSET